MQCEAIPWLLLIVVMSLAFLREQPRGLRRATISALLAGKLGATVLVIAGMDRSIARVTFYSAGGVLASITLTAGELLLILFALSLALTIASESLQERLGLD